LHPTSTPIDFFIQIFFSMRFYMSLTVIALAASSALSAPVK
jgi:hypothetical protein